MRKAILLIFCVVFIAGCMGLRQPYPEITMYSLESGRDFDVAREEGAIALKIKLFAISPRFDTKSLVYKTGEFVYETDYYHRFMTPPAYMITEQIARWLAASPKVKYVADTRFERPIDCTLDGRIVEVYGDFSNKDEAKAVLRIEMVLLDEKEVKPEVIIQKIYSQEIVLKDPTVSALISGFNQGLQNIMTDFESDLGE